MPIERLLEVGIAVSDMDGAMQLFCDMFGLRRQSVKTIGQYEMRAGIATLGDVEFEFMQSSVEESVIGRFVRERGEGLHHIAFEVSDIEGLLRSLRERGVRLIDREPRREGKLKFAFVHPSSCCGTLIELIEHCD